MLISVSYVIKQFISKTNGNNPPMSKPSLTFACGPYDRMEPLYNGTVSVEGVDLVPRVIQTPMHIFGPMLKNGEFDISEMSLTHCFTLRAQGQAKFVTLPVFPSRMFRHGFTYINRRSGIQSPADLEGKRIGVQGYQMTAAVWIRGILEQEYGVSFEGVRWFEGGVNQRGVAGGDATAMHPDPSVHIEPIGNDRTLDEMLQSGEIDALVGAFAPMSLGRNPDVVRLIPDYHRHERDYYRRTGVYPIMHALVIREDVHRKYPWLAGNLYKACVESKNLALKQAGFTGAMRYMLPWLYEHLEEMQEVFGDDPWPYGLEANRPTLAAFGRHLAEQKFLSKPMRLEEVFINPAEGATA